MKRINFDTRALCPDFLAGFPLGVGSIPDAMASAILAGANPIHGLYTVMHSPSGGESIFIAFEDAQKWVVKD